MREHGAARPGPTGIRPEIQALRAVAVGLVVAFHLFPSAVPGGYVGVDVFFVISGFLITGHLLRETERTGRVCVTAFWARRARRLLPAALVTLLACALATLVLVPVTEWRQFLGEIRSSTLYVQNWQLAESAVDYHATDAPASPVRHFWSLSAEEQFYLVWPLLLLIPAVLAPRLGLRRRGVTAALLGLVVAAGFTASVLLTAAGPAAAYYTTTTRAWEFAAGGLLALAGARVRLGNLAAAGCSWIGLGAVALAAAVYGPDTPFPGWAALLPVAGTLAVIAAGAPPGRLAPTPLLSRAPLQAAGGISYSAYLWHWPLIVFAPFVLDGVDTLAKAAIAVLTVLLAWASKVCIEDPARRPGSRLACAAPGTVLATAAAVTVAVLAVPLAGLWRVGQEVRGAELAAQRALERTPPCFGAAARDGSTPGCRDWSPGTVVPAPVAARAEPNAPCAGVRREGPITMCGFGAPADPRRPTVALVGDSHASHWRAAFDVVARRRAWHGESVTHTGCAFSAAIKAAEPSVRAACSRWVRAVPRWLARNPEIHTVILAGIAGGAVVPTDGRTRWATEVAGLRAAWGTLPRSVRRIVVVRDTPRVRSETAGCVQGAADAGRAGRAVCAVPRATALRGDPAVAVARTVRSAGRVARVVDLSDAFCDARRCFPVIGGALVYKDVHHLTAVFARTLAPLLDRRLSRAAGGAPVGARG